MERHLGGGGDDKTAIGVHRRKRTEGLHHRLLVRLGVVGPLHHMLAGFQNLVYIPVGI